MSRLGIVASLVVAVVAQSPTAAAQEGPQAELLERYGESVVPVTVVLETKVNMGGQGQEQESSLDVVGAVVSPRGLVMIWNSHISSQRMGELMERMGRQGFEVEVTPTEFTVMLQDPHREADAFLAATDSTLDLAFLQLSESPEEPLPAIDFGTVGEPEVGDTIYVVDRLAPSFDSAAYVGSAGVGGRLEKPRRAWILDGTLESYGLPVFAADGRPIGALTTIFSSLGDRPDAMGFGQMMNSFMGRRAAVPVGTFVLPADRVRDLVRRAGERAEKLLAERREHQETEEREEMRVDETSGEG